LNLDGVLLPDTIITNSKQEKYLISHNVENIDCKFMTEIGTYIIICKSWCKCAPLSAAQEAILVLLM
jgi:hypothetical protein